MRLFPLGDSLEAQPGAADGQHDELHSQCHRRAFRERPGSWANLSLTPSYPRYAKTVIDADSQYVTFIDATSPAAPGQSPCSTISVSTIPALSGLAVTAESGRSLPPSTTYWSTAIYSEGESEPVTPTTWDDDGDNEAGPPVSWTSAPFNGKQPTGFRVLRGTAAGPRTNTGSPRGPPTLPPPAP